MRADELAALIPPHALLGQCSREELDDLLSRATIQPMKTGSTLMAQGDAGDYLVILLAGDARVSMVAANGREIILDYVGPGAVLGEIALLDGKPRTATVTALTAGKVVRFTRPAFEAFVERHPRLAIRMMRDMARRLRQANDTIENDRAFSSGPRLARFLKRLTDKGADRLRHDLSQSELGNFVGISREHVNRQLAAWAEAGVIQLDQGRIRVMDAGYLDEVAESSH
jgi:CRP-like cAMP-binding protein